MNRRVEGAIIADRDHSTPGLRINRCNPGKPPDVYIVSNENRFLSLDPTWDIDAGIGSDGTDLHSVGNT